MTFDLYMSTLKELSDWLTDYRRVALDTRAITKPITEINKQAARGTKRMTDLSKVELIKVVNHHLTKLMGDSEDYPEMYEDNSSTLEGKLTVLTYTEVERFKQIMANGYLPVFESTDGPRARRDFRQASKHTQVIGAFHKAAKVTAELIDEASRKTTTSVDIPDLYIAIRDLGGAPPLVGLYNIHRVVGLFGYETLEADHYCNRINKFLRVLHRLEPFPELVEVDRNTTLLDLEAVLENSMDRLEEICVDLSYARILSVV